VLWFVEFDYQGNSGWSSESYQS